MAKDIRLLQSEDGMFFGSFNDIDIVNHDMVLIERKEKIAQDIVKFLFTEKGSSPLFKNYGTNIVSYLNARKTNEMQPEITNEVIYAVSYIKQSNIQEAINISSIQSLDVKNLTNGFEIILNLLLTNGELLTIEKNYLR